MKVYFRRKEKGTESNLALYPISSHWSEEVCFLYTPAMHNEQDLPCAFYILKLSSPRYLRPTSHIRGCSPSISLWPFADPSDPSHLLGAQVQTEHTLPRRGTAFPTAILQAQCWWVPFRAVCPAFHCTRATHHDNGWDQPLWIHTLCAPTWSQVFSTKLNVAQLDKGFIHSGDLAFIFYIHFKSPSCHSTNFPTQVEFFPLKNYSVMYYYGGNLMSTPIPDSY